MKISNKILIPSVCALFAACVFLARTLPWADGRGAVVKIYQNGGLAETVDLMSVSKAYTIELEGNTILIEPDGVSVKEANCPDMLCVRQGKIHKPGHSIVCLPNRVVIEISDGESGVDAVAGAR